MRILFVGLPHSIHTARWMNQLSGGAFDLHLFPAVAVDEVGVHGGLRETTVHQVLYGKQNGWHDSVCVADDFWPILKRNWPLLGGANRVRRLAQRLFPCWAERAWHLAQIIRELRPDVVHSLGVQHGGYLTLEASNYLSGRFPPWIVSNWGNDIYLFGRLSDHAEKVRRVLARCDYLWCDCERDVRLAAAFGFKGTMLPVLPSGGGYDIERARQLQQTGPTSARRVIVLKGYQNWAGRALVGLRAIKTCADMLKGYQVAVYSANEDVRIAAELVAQSTNVPIQIVPSCSHEEMLALHGRARVSLGLSISDGLPNSMLEAMIMGSFPIQSSTIGADDVITSGENGFLVHSEDPAAIAEALKRALSDDELIDRATQFNHQIARKRFDQSVIEPHVIAAYEEIAMAKGRGTGKKHIAELTGL